MEEQDCQNSPTAQTFLTKTLAHLFIPKPFLSELKKDEDEEISLIAKFLLY